MLTEVYGYKFFVSGVISTKGSTPINKKITTTCSNDKF